MNTELKDRMRAYTNAIDFINRARIEAELFPEYPEHNALIQEIGSLADGLEARLSGHQELRPRIIYAKAILEN